VEGAEFGLRKLELDPTHGVGLDEVHQLPGDGAGGQSLLESAEGARGEHAFEEAAEGAGEPDVDLGDAELHVIVEGALEQGEVVDTDNFAAVDVNDLLVEEIFADGEPAFIGLVGFEAELVGVEADRARGGRSNLLVAGDQWLIAAAGDDEPTDAVGLLGGDDAELADASNVVALDVVDAGAQEFSGVNHGSTSLTVQNIFLRG
jgi:hypothetical protein